jgi:CheY-like chemotaxis protein
MRYNVLIVEDDRQMAQTLASMLDVLGHNVVVCYGPRMAIQQLSGVIPDVIFMDVHMPGVDGLEMVRYLRRDPATAELPVVIVSAEDQESAQTAAKDAGANYYIIKPPMLDDIEKALAEVVKLDIPEDKPSEPADATPRASEIPPSEPADTAPRASEIPPSEPD